jgi:hypothetical protein
LNDPVAETLNLRKLDEFIALAQIQAEWIRLAE